jgi:hypothetical protein
MGLVTSKSEKPVLKLSPQGDYLSWDDCYAGIHWMARTGGGKTTAASVLAAGLLRGQAGGCVTVAKSSDIALWKHYAKKHGRSESIVLFDENAGFNFLDYDLARHGMDGASGSVVEALMKVIDAARNTSSAASHRPGDVFWEDSMRECLRYTIPALYAANGSVSIPDIIRFVSTAPATLRDPVDRAWQARSFMYKKLNAALCEPKVPMSEAALTNAISFWSERWASMPEKTKGNVVATISSTLDRFNHGKLNRAFCQRTTIVPELSLGGMVTLLAMPTHTWNEVGVIAQKIFKFYFIRMVLTRNSLPQKYRDRPLFIFSDEAQETVDSEDG